MQPKLYKLLHTRRVEDRDTRTHVGKIALVWQGGAFAVMVVSAQNDGSTLGSGTTKVGMFKNITAAVNPWPLAIPDAVHTLNAGTWEQVHELASHHRRGTELFVDGWLVYDIVGLEELTGTCQRQIVASQRRPFITRNKSSGMQSCPRIATLLIESQAHQSLNTRKVYAPFGHGIFIVECQCHGGFLPDTCPPLTSYGRCVEP